MRFCAGFKAANDVLFGLENILVVSLGGLAALDGRITVGMLFAFVAYKTQFADKAGRLLEKAIDAFKKSKPCVLRYLYLITRHSLLSTLKGMGWEALAASKELNNRLDQEYALTASFFDGLLSLDKAANAAHADLMHMLGTSMDDAVSTMRSILDPSTPPPAAAPAA